MESCFGDIRLSDDKVTVIGVDEAGLGPILGPLVISGSAFRVPAEAAREDLWEVLNGCVTREAWQRPYKTMVDDSKVLYTPQVGLEVLEESVLSFARLVHGPCREVTELMDRIDVHRDDLSDVPWYDPAGMRLPLAAEDAPLDERAKTLADGLAACDVEFLGLRVHPVFEREFNGDVDRGANKSVALFRWTAAVICDLLDRHEGDMVLYCDRQGGRRYYTRLWEELYPGSVYRVVESRSEMTHYEIEMNGRRIEIVFGEKGDTRWMPTALASMTSKYIREIYMAQFNAFWVREMPEVKPTAGYFGDARRFLRDVDEVRRRLKIDNETLVRKR